MDGAEFTAQLLMHLIDGNDTVNAKFLFQRVPEPIIQTSESFQKVWTVVKALA